MSLKRKDNRDTMTSMLSCATDQTFQTEGDVEPFLLEKKYETILTRNQGLTILEDQSFHLEDAERPFLETEDATNNLVENLNHRTHHPVFSDSLPSTGSSYAEKFLTDEMASEHMQGSQLVAEDAFNGGQCEEELLHRPSRPQRRGRNLFPPPIRNVTAPARPLPDPKVYKRQQLLKKQISAPIIANHSPPPLDEARVPIVPRIPHQFQAMGETVNKMTDLHYHHDLRQQVHTQQRSNLADGISIKDRRQPGNPSGYPEQGDDRHIRNTPNFTSDEHDFRAHAFIPSAKAQRRTPLPYGGMPLSSDFSTGEHKVGAPGSIYNQEAQRWTPDSYHDFPKYSSSYEPLGSQRVGIAPERPLPPTPPLRYSDEKVFNRSVSSRTLTDIGEVEIKGRGFEYAETSDASCRHLPNRTRSVEGYAAESEAAGIGNKDLHFPYSQNGTRCVPRYEGEVDARGSRIRNDGFHHLTNRSSSTRGATEDFELEGFRGNPKQPHQQIFANRGQAQYNNRLSDEIIQAFGQGTNNGENYLRISHNGHEGASIYPELSVSPTIRLIKRQVTAPEQYLRDSYNDSNNSRYFLAHTTHASNFKNNIRASPKLAESGIRTNLAHVEARYGTQARRNTTMNNCEMQDRTTIQTPIFDKQGNWLSPTGESLSNEEGFIIESQNVDMETAGPGLRVMSEIRVGVENTTEMAKKFRDLSDFRVFLKLSVPDFVEYLKCLIESVMSFAENLRSRDSDFGRSLFEGLEDSGIPRISIMYDGTLEAILAMIGELKLLARHSHGRHKIVRGAMPGLLRDFRTHWEVVVKAMARYVPTAPPFPPGSGIKQPGRPQHVLTAIKHCAEEWDEVEPKALDKFFGRR